MKQKNGEFNSGSQTEAAEERGEVSLDDLPVWKIVEMHNKGYTRAEIRDRFEELTEREIKLAISHYYCNRREVENRIKKEEK